MQAIGQSSVKTAINSIVNDQNLKTAACFQALDKLLQGIAEANKDDFDKVKTKKLEQSLTDHSIQTLYLSITKSKSS